MGSLDNDSRIIGQYMHPVITEDTERSDPWERNYYAPPSLKHLVPRNYPLNDVRPLLSQPGYSSLDLLRSHGFGVAKHSSPFLQQLDTGELSENAITEQYYPEIRDLVCRTTGAKQAFVTGNTFRKGKRAPEQYSLPTSKPQIADATAEQHPHKLSKQKELLLGKPIRVPHMDYTPLAARRTIRRQQQDVLETGQRTEVVATEERICEGQSFTAIDKASDDLIAEHYNQAGNLGPRYVIYSIWRPLKPVSRDPITLAPRKETTAIGGEMVHWNYENRVPGPVELGGDWLRELTMLGVKGEQRAVPDDVLEWYYLSDQQPDEVLFIKLFDSAALGADAEHASAPWHASPEIGDAAKSDEPRESIDVRIIAFW